MELLDTKTIFYVNKWSIMELLDAKVIFGVNKFSISLEV